MSIQDDCWTDDSFSIRHNKKDGAVSIRETIFCEFWFIATTVKKIFDKSCNYCSRALRYRHVATM